jgi:hypothetical protein
LLGSAESLSAEALRRLSLEYLRSKEESETYGGLAPDCQEGEIKRKRGVVICMGRGLRWSLAGGEGEEWSGGKFESASIAAALAAGASLEGRAGGSEGERRASREGGQLLARSEVVARKKDVPKASVSVNPDVCRRSREEGKSVS